MATGRHIWFCHVYRHFHTDSGSQSTMAAVRSVRRKPQSLQFVQSIYSAAHQNKYTGNIAGINLKISLLQECRFLRCEALYSGRSLTTFLGKCTIFFRVKVIVDFYFEAEDSKFSIKSKNFYQPTWFLVNKTKRCTEFQFY